jgi:hypothetical protein
MGTASSHHTSVVTIAYPLFNLPPLVPRRPHWLPIPTCHMAPTHPPTHPPTHRAAASRRPQDLKQSMQNLALAAKQLRGGLHQLVKQLLKKVGKS